MELRELVRNSQNSDMLALPLLHTTKSRWVKDIMTQGRLEPKPCSQFQEELVYVFYGRPAYRNLRKPGEFKGLTVSPTCFILKFQNSADPRRMYPFDSGGYENYKTALPTLLPIDHFELDSSKDNAARFALLFFGSPMAYFDGTFLRSEDLSPTIQDCPAAKQYLSLGENVKSAEDYDDRAFTIELQFNSAVPLNGFTVEAVVIPTALLQQKIGAKTIKEVLTNEWQAEILDYPTWDWLDASEHHGSIVTKIFEYLHGRF